MHRPTTMRQARVTLASRTRVLVAAALVALGSAACADNPAEPSPPPTSVVALMIQGAPTPDPTFQLHAVARLSDGASRDVTSAAAWVSSDPSVATVQAGLVTVRGPGSVEVGASYEGARDTRQIRVGAAAAVRSVAITGDATGPTFVLQAEATLEDGSRQDVTRVASWGSSNSAVASVAPGGLVTVVGTGSVEFRATYNGVSGTRRMDVALDRRFSVRGHVRSATDQAPVAGATVRALHQSVAAAVTDAEGFFSIEGLREGRVIFEVTKVGFEIWSADLLVNRNVDWTILIRPEGEEPFEGPEE